MAQFIGILMVFSLCASAKFVLTENFIITATDTDTTETTLQFVNNAQRKLNTRNHPNIIMVLGMTGSGKSTLIHNLACDNSKLMSIDDGKHIDFVVLDELDAEVDAHVSSTVSRTFIPKAYIDTEQNVFIDCPGFEDTRNRTVEIANAFLMKTTIESASTIKIVLTIEFSSVTDSYNRDGLDKLLSRATQLIKNVRRYVNSMSLVVTKAPPTKPSGRFIVEISDDRIKSTTAQFITDYRRVLQEKRSSESESKIQMLDSILKRSSDGDYPRISIFFRPIAVGPFNTIDKMMAGRQKIRESILNQTVYTELHQTDFGYALSDGAKIQVLELGRRATDIILTKFNEIRGLLQNEIRSQIKSEDDFKKSLDLIASGKNVFKMNRDPNNALTLIQFVDKLKQLIDVYTLKSINMDRFDEIEQYRMILKTLNSLVDTQVMSWQVDPHSICAELVAFLNNLEIEIQTGITNRGRKFIEIITNGLTSVDTKILQVLREKIRSTNGFQAKLRLLKIKKKCLAKKEITLKQRTDHLRRLADAFDATSIDRNELDRIENLEKAVRDLKSIAKHEIVIPDWIASSSNAIDYQCSESDWYSFLDQTYRYLASDVVQRNVQAYNVGNINDWGQSNKPQGLSINQNNFNQFINRIAPSFVGLLEPKSSRFQEINEMIKDTLQSQPKYTVNGDTLIIEGNFVKSSAIRPSYRVKKIRVYAIDTFYVDSDLHLNDIEDLHIFAYTWQILEPAIFHLKGAKGASQAPPNANGMAGQPGNVGQNGGNFFGLANQIVNGDKLTVETVGGDGGDGQDGTGNPDTTVRFDRTSDMISYWAYIGRKGEYLINLIISETGISNVQTLKYDETFLLVFLINVESEFRVYSDKCCGVTGAGGLGKTKSST